MGEVTVNFQRLRVEDNLQDTDAQLAQELQQQEDGAPSILIPDTQDEDLRGVARQLNFEVINLSAASSVNRPPQFAAGASSQVQLPHWSQPQPGSNWLTNALRSPQHSDSGESVFVGGQGSSDDLRNDFNLDSDIEEITRRGEGSVTPREHISLVVGARLRDKDLLCHEHAAALHQEIHSG